MGHSLTAVTCLYALCLITSLASSMFSGHSTQTFFYLEFSTTHSTLGMFSRYKEVIILVRPPSGAPYSPSLWPPSPQNHAIPDILNSLFTLPIQPYPTHQARRKLLTVGPCLWEQGQAYGQGSVNSARRMRYYRCRAHSSQKSWCIVGIVNNSLYTLGNYWFLYPQKQTYKIMPWNVKKLE